jgi:hypothetical protein
MEFESLGKENQNAMDNFRGLACFVVSRTRHFLHDGRVHPHLVGLGYCYRFDQSDSGPKGDFLIVETNR